MSEIDRVRRASWLEVSCRKTISGAGESEKFSSLFCPFQEKTVALGDCHACEFVDGVARDLAGDPTAVLCSRDLAERSAHDLPLPDSDASTSFDLRTPLSALMTRRVTCVTADVSLDSLRTLFLEKGYGSVPVVAADGKPIGVVTKTDLLRDFDSFEGFAEELPSRGMDGFSGRPIVRAVAADLMSRAVVSLPEEAPVSRAAAVMAFEGIQHVVVVSATDGTVIGILSSSDVMRAIGSRAGYRVPKRDRRRKS